ncbi:hypothetical protein ACIPH4_26435 [Streptomyces tendae]|uniref:hypothetical protein n=1 Tax=Streptomyces tendae TaxID=1932 RepID=UPI00368434B1
MATSLLLKEAGLGLNTIRSLTTSADRATRHAILSPAAEELRSTIAAARASLQLIESGLDCEFEDSPSARPTGGSSPSGLVPLCEIVVVYRQHLCTLP